MSLKIMARIPCSPFCPSGILYFFILIFCIFFWINIDNNKLALSHIYLFIAGAVEGVGDPVDDFCFAVRFYAFADLYQQLFNVNISRRVGEWEVAGGQWLVAAGWVAGGNPLPTFAGWRLAGCIVPVLQKNDWNVATHGSTPSVLLFKALGLATESAVEVIPIQCGYHSVYISVQRNI